MRRDPGHQAGEWPAELQEIFRLGEGPPGGPSPLIEVRDLRIRRGNIELAAAVEPA